MYFDEDPAITVLSADGGKIKATSLEESDKTKEGRGAVEDPNDDDIDVDNGDEHVDDEDDDDEHDELSPDDDDDEEDDDDDDDGKSPNLKTDKVTITTGTAIVATTATATTHSVSLAVGAPKPGGKKNLEL